MNARNILSASAIALLGSLAVAAHAGELNDADYRGQAIKSSRPVAAAHAEGVYAAQHITSVSSSSYVHQGSKSNLARADVRASAIQAQRSGVIANGETVQF